MARAAVGSLCATPRTTAIVLALVLALAPAGAADAEEHDAKASAVEAEGHGAGHGEAHHPVHLDNWFSFSFGPGKHYQNGPFGFAILNFIILVWLVTKLARKPLAEYLEKRHATIKRDLEEAAELNAQSRSKLDEISVKLGAIDRELAAIKEGAAREAELERERLIRAAEAEAERIVKAADETMQRELRRARRRLEIEAVSAAMTAAEKLVKREVSDADRKRLDDEYFASIAKGGSIGAAGGPR
jgi:F-type H+-transporting ATPase subunit b